MSKKDPEKVSSEIEKRKRTIAENVWSYIGKPIKWIIVAWLYFLVTKFNGKALKLFIQTSPKEDQIMLSIPLTFCLFLIYFYKFSWLVKIFNFVNNSGKVICQCAGILCFFFILMIVTSLGTQYLQIQWELSSLGF